MSGDTEFQGVLIRLYILRNLKEKAVAAHSSTLAWGIPWTEEPGGLQSMGSLRVRHDWATSLSLFTFMHWRRKWQPTPVFLPGESQGWGSLVGFHLWGPTELDVSDWSNLTAAVAAMLSLDLGNIVYSVWIPIYSHHFKVYWELGRWVTWFLTKILC